MRWVVSCVAGVGAEDPQVERSEQETQRAIGRLEGKLDSLIASVQQQGERSDAGRQRLYQRVDQLAQEFVTVKNRVANIETRVDEIEPMAAEFMRWKQRGVGIWIVIVTGWMLLGGLVLSGVSAMGRWFIKVVVANS
jgi:predicted RNase H-like nuclease (RuvC/YqgF family)